MTDPVAHIRRRFASLALEAEAALQRREEQYPALVDAGKIPAEQSAQEIRVWRAIAADWRRVVDGAGDAAIWGSRDDKIAALRESIRRYNKALARVIGNAPDAVRRDCGDGTPLWRLDEKHGEAFAPILAVIHQRDRVEDMLDWYLAEQPGSNRLGIGGYLELNRILRERANGAERVAA
ncbi:hypothetical protein SAMN02927924_02782 [Sphingobium faniae]|nr:hypothetical protein SAMN02927924_02782 [Sphingobium faniae]